MARNAGQPRDYARNSLNHLQIAFFNSFTSNYKLSTNEKVPLEQLASVSASSNQGSYNY